ncbi:hypothetical protein NQZ68_031301, partial [Dissostichus eleginoides]
MRKLHFDALRPCFLQMTRFSPRYRGGGVEQLTDENCNAIVTCLIFDTTQTHGKATMGKVNEQILNCFNISSSGPLQLRF